MVAAAKPRRLSRTDESRLANRGNSDRARLDSIARAHQMVDSQERVAANRDDADDMTQETFFKVYRSLGQFEGRSQLKTWIYRIAINTCQNELRRRSRRPQESETEMEKVAEFISSSLSVEKQVQEKARRERLAAAFATVRPEEFEVLQMKDLQQMAYADIAAALGIGLSAAKMRVQRARLALQAVYHQLAEE